MYKKLAIKFLFFLLLTTCILIGVNVNIGSSAELNPSGLTDEDFILGSIQLGAPTTELNEKYGKALSFRETPSSWDIRYKDQIYMYKNISFVCVNDKILKIDVSSPEYPTYRGIKVGDTLQEILEKYGKKVLVQNSNKHDAKFYNFTCANSDIYFIIDNKTQKVKGIGVTVN